MGDMEEINKLIKEGKVVWVTPTKNTTGILSPGYPVPVDPTDWVSAGECGNFIMTRKVA